MNIRKLTYFSSQKLLFSMWNFGLVLPKYVHDSSGVFRHENNHSCFIYCLIKATIDLYTLLLSVLNQNYELMDVELFVSFTYIFCPVFTSWFFIMFFHFNVQKINEISRIVGRLDGIYRKDERVKNLEEYWLIFTSIWYIVLLISLISHLVYKSSWLALLMSINTHSHFILDIQVHHFFVVFTWILLQHFIRINESLGGTNRSQNEEVMPFGVEIPLIMSLDKFSWIILVKCGYFFNLVTVFIFFFYDVEYSGEYFNVKFTEWMIISSWTIIMMAMIFFLIFIGGKIVYEVCMRKI